MNQILSMDGGMGTPNGGNNGNILGGKEPKVKKGPLETKTTVMIFAIVLIVFGLAVFITGLVNLMIGLSGNGEETEKWPMFDWDLQEQNVLYVTISHNAVIDKVIYYWDGGFEHEMTVDNQKNTLLTLEVPVGTHILTVISIDKNGIESEFQQTFTGVSLEAEPEIEMSIMHSKLNISAMSTTNTRMAYIEYSWNDGEITRVPASFDNATVEAQVSIPKGKNTITVTAVKENGVSRTETQTFDGIEKPIIDVVLEGTRLRVTVEHESGISNIACSINQRNVAVSADNKKVVTFSLPYKSGQVNVVNIEAQSVDGSTATFVKEF